MARGRKAWAPSMADTERAIAERKRMATIEDIALDVLGVDPVTVYRHFNRCGKCQFCKGMKRAPASSRLIYVGKLHEYATDKTSPYHYKALVLMATHSPGSPLRQRVSVSGESTEDPVKVAYGLTPSNAEQRAYEAELEKAMRRDPLKDR